MRPETAPFSEKSDPASPVLPDGRALRERDERLRAMKGLVGHLAHSFNNSLAPLAGYINLLIDEVRKGSPGEVYLGKVDISMRKAEALVSAVVQATHPERQFVPKPADLAAIVQRTTDAWSKNLPEESAIVVTLDLAPCWFSLDETQWTKVIQQLLDNAGRALDGEGSLRVSLAKTALNAEQAAAFGWREGEVYCLTFEDTGCGMDDEVLHRACEPLFTTRPHGPTAGLGLTMVHSVVQLHGGQIAFNSPDQAGTCVQIWLPPN